MSTQSELGAGDDIVVLELGGEQMTLYSGYSVETSIFTQPAAWSLRLGSGATAKELIAKAPPNTPFKIRIGGTLVQSGMTDGFEGSDGEGATEVTFSGRDALAPLHDGYVLAENSFVGVTYEQIVEKALRAVGIGSFVLVFDNDANRKAISGGKAAPNKTPAPAGQKPIGHIVYVRIGDRWYDFVRSHLERAGLFLWAGADGTFIITRPNASQRPTYRITRKRGQTRDEVNAIGAHYRNMTTHRFSHCVVYARGGGKKHGVSQSLGRAVDAQMKDAYGYGESKPLVLRDVDAKDVATAEFHAKRKLAEAARSGWAVGYTMAGHTAPALGGGRAVWAADTMVEVDDDEYGIHGTYWIESVTFRRDPKTTTDLVLMDPQHLAFLGAD